MTTSVFYFFPLITAPLFVFMVTLSLIWWLIKGNTLKILDRPNCRSLHTTPVSRTGGLGMLPGILISWVLLPAALPLPAWIGVSLLAAVSFADDVLTLPVWWRLLTHSVVAAWFAAVLLADAHGWLIATVVTVAIVWMINLYNFMDGSDGLAGGMTLIGFGYYGLAAWLVGNETFAMLNFCIVAAAAAFLLFNFHPARIFMGDVGAIPLGFLAASFGILGWTNGLWTLWLPLLVFSPFIADASVTLAKRCLRREKIWQAHREHYYQRLVQSGFGHYNTALFGYVLMLAAGASAVWAARQDSSIQLGVGAAWFGVYLAMMLAFDRHARRRNSG
jgi:UDP-N-acetylmuramyl pentapeptide phosphotransferase/UDP-N-acetylglucosamine-1-phosphate transferase